MEPPTYFSDNGDPRQRTHTVPQPPPEYTNQNKQIPFDMQAQFGQMVSV